jgi:hypothetical protein
MIDFHTHPVMVRELFDADAQLESAVRGPFGFGFPAGPLSLFLREMDAAGVDQAVLLALDCTTAWNCCIPSNQAVASLCSQEERFIGFASVDPNLAEAPVQLASAIHQLGLCGVKLDPALQRFQPDDRQLAYPVYQVCAELGIPVLIHMGLSWAPKGMAKYAQPLLLEPALQDFPQVNFVLAHCGWPWVLEASMLALKYPNAFLDTAVLFSGTPGDALQRVLAEQIGVDTIERSLMNKIVFGSNYPRVDMRRTARGFASVELTYFARKAIASQNALRLLAKI